MTGGYWALRYGGPLHELDAWTGVLAFAGQIFFDFSGYSTCAIGAALCLRIPALPWRAVGRAAALIAAPATVAGRRACGAGGSPEPSAASRSSPRGQGAAHGQARARPAWVGSPRAFEYRWRMSASLRSHLPEVYRSRLPAFFDRPPIVETRATCSDCAMCDKAGPAEAVAPVGGGFFRPEVKCCSYHPTLPNFLAGAALQDASSGGAEGRRRLRAKVSARIGVTPVWLEAPRKFLVLYDAARESSFGRSDALLCPYFERDTATCSIWAHRESVCATFFCKHVAGAAGHAFWGALKRYLSHVEASLARYAAESVLEGPPAPDLPRTKLTREDLEDRPPDDAGYAATWGRWVGREEAFYGECAVVAASLGATEWERVVDAAGGDHLLADLIARHEEATAPVLAARLVLNREHRATTVPGGVLVTTYSNYDPLFLTQDVYDALRSFSADEATAISLERVRREHGVDLPAARLLELQLHGVVTPPGATPRDVDWR